MADHHLFTFDLLKTPPVLWWIWLVFNIFFKKAPFSGRLDKHKELTGPRLVVIDLYLFTRDTRLPSRPPPPPFARVTGQDDGEPSSWLVGGPCSPEDGEDLRHLYFRSSCKVGVKGVGGGGGGG